MAHQTKNKLSIKTPPRRWPATPRGTNGAGGRSTSARPPMERGRGQGSPRSDITTPYEPGELNAHGLPSRRLPCETLHLSQAYGHALNAPRSEFDTVVRRSTRTTDRSSGTAVQKTRVVRKDHYLNYDGPIQPNLIPDIPL